ncbi:MAG: exodeoxyribonuclease V subunit alpha, partial [Gammaproteobacteria bacterium]|nr:exodeoxyribonuclease V subunit alpha [Gammaproteobacteria bacterium]
VVSGATSSGLQAVFPGLDGKVMRYSLNRLPEYEPAYAITTHKAQGSQARRVFFILPAKNSRVLSKELIYTGITRARESVEIWGDPEVLISAATKSAARPTGLSEQMQCL